MELQQVILIVAGGCDLVPEREFGAARTSIPDPGEKKF
jgi:hypothetical protein